MGKCRGIRGGDSGVKGGGREGGGKRWIQGWEERREGRNTRREVRQ